MYHDRTLSKIVKKMRENLGNLPLKILINARNYLSSLDVYPEDLIRRISELTCDSKNLSPREISSIGTPDVFGFPSVPFERLIERIHLTNDPIVSYKHRLALIASVHLSRSNEWEKNLCFQSLESLKRINDSLNFGRESFKERAGMFFDYKGRLHFDRVDIGGVFSTSLVRPAALSVENKVSKIQK